MGFETPFLGELSSRQKQIRPDLRGSGAFAAPGGDHRDDLLVVQAFPHAEGTAAGYPGL